MIFSLSRKKSVQAPSAKSVGSKRVPKKKRKLFRMINDGILDEEDDNLGELAEMFSEFENRSFRNLDNGKDKQL